MFQFKPRRAQVLIAALSLLILAGAANAGPVLSVYTSIGPDPFGSGSTFTQYSQNALYALQNTLSAHGTPGTPAYYQQAGGFGPGDVIGTDFPSWMGQASPAGNYAGQTGNMLQYGLTILGNGTQFALSDVTEQDTWIDGSSSGVQSLAAIGYGDRILGIYYGPDGIPGTADDVLYNAATAGSENAMVDALYFSGFGAQFYLSPAYLASACPGATTDQAKLDCGISNIAAADRRTASAEYTLTLDGGSFRGSGSAGLTGTPPGTVPEPSTFALMGLGAAVMAAVRRRKK